MTLKIFPEFQQLPENNEGRLSELIQSLTYNVGKLSLLQC